MKNTIGPATTGNATSQPLTDVPQRRPARLSARMKNGTRVNLNANSADIRPPGVEEEIYSIWYLLGTRHIPNRRARPYGTRQRTLPQTESRVPFPGDRAPCPGLRRDEPVRERHPP